MAFSSGGDYCLPVPTPTPTPVPVFTSLEMWEGGKDEALLGVLFWATFYETQEDRQNSGPVATPTLIPSTVPLIHHDTPLSRFLHEAPLCVNGAKPPSNNAEPQAIIEADPANLADDYWIYIQHCYDHRFMYARTLLNGFLSYQRRGAIPLRYTEPNLRSFNETNNLLWAYPACRTQAGFSSREAARYADLMRPLQDRLENGSIEADWLFGYMHCMGASMHPDVLTSAVGQRIQNAYYHTIWPQVKEASRAFYETFVPDVTTGDPTFGAYSNLDVNENGSPYVVCVGGCVVRSASGTERTERGAFTLTQGERISQFLVNVLPPMPVEEQQDLVRQGYDTYLDYLTINRNYRSNYASVIQPVLTLELAPSSNDVVGYIWTSRVYMRSPNMVHFPRVTP
jgi:hypothetical protein